MKCCLLMVKDLCNHYRSRTISFNSFFRNDYRVINKPKNNFADFVPIKFVSKELETLDINSILNDSSAMKLFPAKHLSKKFSNQDFRFSTCFKYEKSIRSNIINYKENILDEGPISDIKCFCHLYPNFVNHSIGHVITGNVNIVENRKLRKLFKKGHSYIEPIYKNKWTIFNSIKSDLNAYVKKLTQKFSVNTKYFDGWKVTVLDIIKTKLFNSKIFCKRSQSVFFSEANDLNTLCHD